MCLSVITMSSWKIIYSGPLPIFQKVWHFDTELYEVFVYFGVINLYQMSCVCLVAQLCLTLCNLMDYSPPGSTVHGDSPGKNTGVGCHALLQGIFQTQGSNPGLPQCRQILYLLRHKGSPRILKWVAFPFSRGSSRPRDWNGVSCIAGRFSTSWAKSLNLKQVT